MQHNKISYFILRNDVIRDQLADCPNNRLSYLYLKMRQYLLTKCHMRQAYISIT